MSNSTDRQNKTAEFLKTFWPLLVAIISIAVAWGRNDTRAEATDLRLSTLEAAQIKTSDTLTTILVGQSGLAADVSFIKSRVK